MLLRFVKFRREQVVIMEEDDQDLDQDVRNVPQPDPVYTISNDLRLQQTRVHQMESQAHR